MSIDAQVEEGRAAWPDLDLEPARFAVFLRARLEADGEPVSRVADFYLACACLAGVAGAWNTLDRLYLRRVGLYVTRVDRSPSFADEIRQRVSEKLAHGGPDGVPKLALYNGKGSLEGWIRIAALREARNAKRDVKPVEDPDDQPLVAAGDDPELLLTKRHFAAAFRAAFEDVLASLEPDQRSVLRLHYLDGLTLEQVGRALRVSRATAARCIASAKDTIIERVRAELGARLGRGAPAPDSVLALVESKLDMSVRRHFADVSPRDED